jgi:hypothetical protein
MPQEANKFDNALKQFARRASCRRKDDNFERARQRQRGGKDGNTVCTHTHEIRMQVWKSSNLFHLKVLPKRLGVEIKISEEHFVHLFFSMMTGLAVDQSFLYMTRLVARMNASWNINCCRDL